MTDKTDVEKPEKKQTRQEFVLGSLQLAASGVFTAMQNCRRASEQVDIEMCPVLATLALKSHEVLNEIDALRRTLEREPLGGDMR